MDRYEKVKKELLDNLDMDTPLNPEDEGIRL